MSGTLILTLVLAVSVGLALGTLGGGGSILTVPLLTYIAGMPPKEAIAASLLIVGVMPGELKMVGLALAFIAAALLATAA